jgi:hypothetical protein
MEYHQGARTGILNPPMLGRKGEDHFAPTSPQNPNTGVVNLVIRIPQMTQNTAIEVLFSVPGTSTPVDTLGPLSTWGTKAAHLSE